MWKEASKILGKSRPARLMVLGLFMITSGGIGRTVSSWLGLNPTVPDLIFAFGILAFVLGLGDYLNTSKTWN